jgi:UDPglucose 6-dehydrogenase
VKVAVYGLWHLGAVTAACLAEAGIDTIAIDEDAATIERLARGAAPLFEPGLDALLAAGLASGRLQPTTRLAAAGGADVTWVTFDTPTGDDDRSDPGWVVARVERLFPHLRDAAVVLVSSQLPVGTTAAVAARCAAGRGPGVAFAYSPENLQLGRALEAFRRPPARIVGVAGEPPAPLVALFQRLGGDIAWMSVESAEMVKHALNSYLALCIAFTNEVAALCELTGADAREVEEGLRLDPRVGRSAYVRAGAAFAGGTLARDVTVLARLAAERGSGATLLPAILESNGNHQSWPVRALESRLGELAGKRIALLGLAYKPGTDTQRRSPALQLASTLSGRGAAVNLFDALLPGAAHLPPGSSLANSLEGALAGADGVVVGPVDALSYPLTAAMLTLQMRRPLLIDPDRRFESLAGEPGIEYVAFGRPRVAIATAHGAA